MSNIIEVARKAGVSPSTVSNVFTCKRPVSRKTRELVLKVSHELNYMPSVMASSNITKQTNIIGFFFDTGNSDYSDLDSDMIKGCAITAAENGKRLMLYYGIQDKQELFSTLRSGCQPIDGAILTLPHLDDFRLDAVTSQSVPYVIIGEPYQNNPQVVSVDVDNRKVAYRLTSHLIHLGHKRIAMLNYRLGYTVARDRLAGYLDALREHGLPVDERLIVHTGKSEDDGRETTSSLLSRSPFTAVLVSMPEVARGVYTVIQQNGMQVGRDISVVSFNPDHSGLTPPLSCGKPDYVQLGSAAVRSLIQVSQSPHLEARRTLLEAEMVFTDSCGPCTADW
jgi:transcriptional regulator, lacI family